MPHLPREKVEDRKQPRYLNKAVCRNLFGTVDHDELRRDLKTQLKEIKNSHCQRWNFDFEKHSPLAGRYIWKAFDTRDLPTFYRDPSSPLSVPEPEEAAKGLEGSGKAKAEGKNSSNNRGKAGRSRKRETPTPITDFFPKCKRTVISKPLIPRMETPRKRIR